MLKSLIQIQGFIKVNFSFIDQIIFAYMWNTIYMYKGHVFSIQILFDVPMIHQTPKNNLLVIALCEPLVQTILSIFLETELLEWS